MAAELCRCGEDVTTVRITTKDGEVRACRRCASVAQMVAELCGAKTQRGPVLELIRGSVGPS